MARVNPDGTVDVICTNCDKVICRVLSASRFSTALCAECTKLEAGDVPPPPQVEESGDVPLIGIFGEFGRSFKALVVGVLTKKPAEETQPVLADSPVLETRWKAAPAPDKRKRRYTRGKGKP